MDFTWENYALSHYWDPLMTKKKDFMTTPVPATCCHRQQRGDTDSPRNRYTSLHWASEQDQMAASSENSPTGCGLPSQAQYITKSFFLN
ncbi:hypothetical protein UPYG_G00027900 [Umbra pygmaea]|uniref:Uncharacterized protein n=1 Tax=Umbra pygmaea TaxID=75934 RepID=A0ABD0XM55_UMBPY